jgi:excinuclease ABC subunit C
MLPLDQAVEFDPARDVDFFAALPARPAVYRIEPRAEGAHPYLRCTSDLRRSCRRVLGPPESAGPSEIPSGDPGERVRTPRRPRLNLRDIAARVRYRLTGSAFEQSLALYEQARELFPTSYRQRMRLAPPALLKINLANDYPRCYVAQRLLDDGAFYFGPFPSRRAAEDFAQAFLNFFKIRRCHIRIRRDPSFPGCIYSELKMCLAPCFAGCTKLEYDDEVVRVEDFLSSCGQSLGAELEAERDRAAGAEDFERAAAIHKKHEKVSSILRHLPDLPRRLAQLHAVILQPASAEGTVAAFRVHAGKITNPFLLNFRELSAQPRSVETILREYLESASPPELLAGPLADHLSLLARWYYSKPRAGEIFFPEGAAGAAANQTSEQSDVAGSTRTAWPYRRIIRACSRVLGPQTLLPPGPSGARSAGDPT